MTHLRDSKSKAVDRIVTSNRETRMEEGWDLGVALGGQTQTRGGTAGGFGLVLAGLAFCWRRDWA